MHMRLIGLSLCLVLHALPAMSAPPAQQDDIARVQTLDKENDIAQIQAQVQILDKEVAVLKEVSDNRLDAQDQRIGDLDIWTGQQANYMAAISNVTALVGVAIALIAVGAGFIVYFSATSRASAEARRASERWFQQHEHDLRAQIGALHDQTNSLQSQLDAFRQKAEDAHGEIDRKASEFDDHAKQQSLVIDQAAQQVLAKHQDGQQPVDLSAIAAVQQASLALQEKPENSFTSDDHYARGLNEYIAGRFDSALLSFDKALLSAEVESISPENNAKLLNARAVALHQLSHREEAMAIYDEIEHSYGADTNPALRERVAKALVNKGVALQEIARSEEAITIHDEIDRRYGGDANPALRVLVARALNDRAYLRSLQAKQHWQTGTEHSNLLALAISDLGRAKQQCANDRLPEVLGNLGYALFLSGAIDEAEVHTRECLLLGQMASLEWQRGNTQMHRVEPQDSEYERLLDRLWEELSG